ncbi:hypothetical protein BDW_00870 [Bdellovibrio bacteriovorus W]|nr:hypothetical protein BDW_00870 [Bdellovibrio bacteriovorus W]
MDIQQQLTADVKAAMIAKDSLKLGALRMLQAAIKNREIELRPNAITPDDVLAIVKKLAKQRKESIEQFQQAGRQDLVDQESAELKVLEVYLPAQMGREQVEALVTESIASLGAKSVKDMGAVMKDVIAKANGAADNKLVSEIIKSKLV